MTDKPSKPKHELERVTPSMREHRDILEAERKRSIKDITFIPYSLPLAELIIEKVLEGKTLTSVCSLDGMPKVRDVYMWLRQHEDFKEMYDYALKAKALYAMDKIEDIAEESRYATKDEIPGMKLAFEGYKLIAERHDRTRYGAQEAKAQGGNTIIINTGINPDPNDTRTVNDLILEMQSDSSEV